MRDALASADLFSARSPWPGTALGLHQNAFAALLTHTHTSANDRMAQELNRGGSRALVIGF